MDAQLDDLSQQGTTSTMASNRTWVVLCCLLGLLTATTLVFLPTAKVLHSQWLDEGLQTYTHGYLIVAICVWLLMRERVQLASATIRPNVLAGIVLAAASVFWLITYRAGIQTAHQIIFAGILSLAALTALGRRAFFIVAFAFGYFFFSIRIWDFAISPLQWGTTAAVHFLLQLSAVPAFVEGNLVHLAAGTFEIADGCSGLHFMIVGVALAALYGEINRDSLRTRFALLALATGLALLTNWLRVYVIVVAGYLTDMQHYLVRVEHYRFGWVVFALSMLLFFFIARRFPLSKEQSGPTSNTFPATVKPMVTGVLLAGAAALVGPAWNWLAPVRAASTDGVFTSDTSIGPQHWQIRFDGADVIHFDVIRSGGLEVESATAMYLQQGDGKELLGYGNTLTADPVAKTTRIVRRQAPAPLIESSVHDGRRNWLMWHFYEIDGTRTNRALQAQLLYGYKSLFGAPLSRVVALRAECIPDCEAARDSLEVALRVLDDSRRGS